MDASINSSIVYALTGACGHLGRLVLSRLLDLVPASQIIAGTRHPEKLGDFAALGVDVRLADFNDPASLTAAFSGATRLLIISSGDYEEILSGRRMAQHEAAVAAAVARGIGYIAYTSCPNATSAEAQEPVVRDHAHTEELLAASGAAWTALRNNVYMGGVPYFLEALRIGDRVLVPEGSVEVPWVAHEDCARTAASVLAGRVDIKGAVDVTGPEALGFAALTRRWASLQGRRLDPMELSEDQAIAKLVAKGMPSAMAQGIVGNATGSMSLCRVPVADTVERATGIGPVSVDRVLRELAIE